MRTWSWSLGNTGSTPVFTCRADPGIGQRFGTPRDLTGATSIIGTVRRWSDRAIVQSAAATLVSAPAGTVTLPMTTMISTSPGLHAVSFTVIDPTSQHTYPGPLTPQWLLCAAVLDGGSAVALPDPGAPLFIAASAAGTVAANGQLVFAGPSSTITVPAGVSWFQLAASGVWAVGTTPTIVQAGSTLAAGMAAVLLASGGNLVIVTLAATVLTATPTGRATIWAYNGATYGPDPDARLIERGLGEPAPTGVVDNDIVLQQNP